MGVRSLQEEPPGELLGTFTSRVQQPCRSSPQRYSSRNFALSCANSSRLIAPATSSKPQSDAGTIELTAVNSIKETPFKFPMVRTRHDESDTARMLALRQLGKDMKRQEMLGYMYRQLKGELYYFRLLFFVTSFGFAAVSVLPSDPTLRLFLTGVFLATDLFITCSLTPFETWRRNVLTSVVSLFGVVQIFVMLALVELGTSSGDGSSVDLGHSTMAEQQSGNPSSSLTGANDEATRYELYFGIILIMDVLGVAYVHRKTILSALRWLRDTLQPTAHRLYGRCVSAAVAARDGCVVFGRAIHTSAQRIVEWLTGLTRVIELQRGWMWSESPSESTGWSRTSTIESVSTQAVGDEDAVNRAVEQTNEQNETRQVVELDDGTLEHPMDDEVELKRERLAQYAELLSPHGSEPQQRNTAMQQQQMIPPADEWPTIPLGESDAKEQEQKEELRVAISDFLKMEAVLSPQPLPTSGVLNSTSDATTMRNSLRYVIINHPWRRGPQTRTVGLKVDTHQSLHSSSSVPLSPYSAPTRALNSRTPRQQVHQTVSPRSSAALFERASTPGQHPPVR